MRSALDITRILYRDGAVVLRDPRVRIHLLPKLINIKRSIGIPETDNEQLLLNNVARLERLVRAMNRG